MWNRFKRAVRSFVGYFVDTVEDPELILQQNVRDLNDQVPRMNENIAMVRANVTLLERETARLLNVAPRAYQTQINDLLLTALAQAVRTWAETFAARVDSVLVALEGHGREDLFEEVDVTRTMGWFTSVYPVRLTPHAGDLGRTICGVRDELRRVPQRGLGYGVLRYSSPERERL